MRLFCIGVLLAGLALALLPQLIGGDYAIFASVSVFVVWMAYLLWRWGTEKIKSSEKREDKRLPVTIVTGFLGSGKTTLVNHILKSNGGTHGKSMLTLSPFLARALSLPFSRSVALSLALFLAARDTK